VAKPEISDGERALLNQVLKDPSVASVFKKIFAAQEQYFTEQARNHLNVIPESLDQKIRRNALASQFAAMAKAWGQAWSEITKVADL
jgi:hypothetical protein